MAKLRTDEQIGSYLRVWIPEFRKDYVERLRQTDRVIVWLVGLSTGGLALLLSQYSKIDSGLYCHIKWATIFLVSAIISGVVFRGVFYLTEALEVSHLFNIEGFCHGIGLEANGPRALPETCTPADIVGYLKDDMGSDGYEEWLKDDLPRDFWVKVYMGQADLWNQFEKDGMRRLGEIMAPFVGKSVEEGAAILLENPEQKRKSVELLKVLRKVRDGAYYFTLLCFLLAIVTISVGVISFGGVRNYRIAESQLVVPR
jgi:hypothetical protein